MKTRIITAVVLLIALLPAIVFSDTVIFTAVISFLCLISTIEMMKCIGCEKRYSFSVPASVISALFPVGARYIQNKNTFLILACTVLYLFMIYIFFISVLSRGKIKISDNAMAFSAVLYVNIGYTSVALLRELNGGEYLYLLVFVAACVTDIFAYFTGRLFGRHKLIEEVSPKKTIEGAIGGLVFCSVSFVVYGILILECTQAEQIAALAVIGLVVSVISQLGDLVASLIKREFGIKDFGKILPGHGGFLDRFDSAIAIAPVLLVAMMAMEKFSVFM